MPKISHRREKVASSMQHALGRLFAETYRIGPELEGLRFVLHSVKLSQDLSECAFFVSGYRGIEQIPDANVLELLADRKSRIRLLLSRAVPLEVFPNIRFASDRISSNVAAVCEALKRAGFSE